MNRPYVKNKLLTSYASKQPEYLPEGDFPARPPSVRCPIQTQWKHLKGGSSAPPPPLATHKYMNYTINKVRLNTFNNNKFIKEC